MDKYLDPEQMNEALKGATITGFRPLLNGRDVLLETTAGSVLMTNEISYKFLGGSEVKAAVSEVPFLSDNGC